MAGDKFILDPKRRADAVVSLSKNRTADKRTTSGSNCLFAAFTGADSNRFGEVGDENFAVANLAGAGHVHDRIDCHLARLIGHDDFDLCPGQAKSTVYSAPRYISLWPCCPPNPRSSETIMPCMPTSLSAFCLT